MPRYSMYHCTPRNPKFHSKNYHNAPYHSYSPQGNTSAVSSSLAHAALSSNLNLLYNSTFATHFTPTSSSCSSVTLPQLNLPLETLLKDTIGDFSLTFYRNGQLCTIGDLQVEKHLPSPVSVSTPLKFSSTVNTRPLPSSSSDASPVLTCDSVLTSESTLDSHSAVNPCSDYQSTHSLHATRDFDNVDEYRFVQEHNDDNRDSFPSQQSHILFSQTAEELSLCVDPQLTPVNVSSINPTSASGRESPSISPKRPHQENLLKSVEDFISSEWSIEPDVEFMSNIELTYHELTSMNSASIKSLAADLIRALYPGRRKTYPYKAGIKPRYGWPKSLRYKDPAHLHSDERFCLIIWMYINPSHEEGRLEEIHKELDLKWGTYNLQNLAARAIVLHRQFQLY